MDDLIPKVNYLQSEFLDLIQGSSGIIDFIDHGALDGIWYRDLEDRDCEWSSPKLLEFLGISEEETAQNPAWRQDYLHPDDRAKEQLAIEACIADAGRRYDQILRYIHKDGRTLWVRCRGMIVRDQKGKAVRMFGAHIDVTDQKVQESKLKLAGAAAQEASQAKGTFLSNMAHEIRTPLSGILGMMELLEAGELESDQREKIGIAKQCARTLTSIINSVLDLSKLQYGKQRANIEAFEPRKVFEQAAQPLHDLARDKGLDFKLSLDGCPRQKIESDPDRLCQLIYNLVGNAIKYTHQGHVLLSIRYVENRASLQGAWLVITVEDTGPGISDEDQKRIFKRFERLKGATRSDDAGGIGLGLSIVKELIHLLDGKLELRSVLEQGSVFECRIPVAATAAEELPEPVEPVFFDKWASTARLLVAEDNLVNQRLIRDFLEILGIAATMVSDGDEAVHACRHENFDIILMDMQMPRMGGLEACRAIRSISAYYAHIPIIALTANAYREDVRKGQASGMTDHLSKPYSLQDLKEVLLRQVGLSH